MRVLSWNVNGLRAAHKKGFLDWFDGESPDIMCLQETKAHEEQLPEEIKSIPGYTSYFSTPEKKGYSYERQNDGACDTHYQIFSPPIRFSHPNTSFDGAVLSAHIATRIAPLL